MIIPFRHNSPVLTCDNERKSEASTNSHHKTSYNSSSYLSTLLFTSNQSYSDKIRFSGHPKQSRPLETHQEVLALHKDVVELAKSVLPIYTSRRLLTVNPENIDDSDVFDRSGFVIDNPYDPGQKIIVTAAHGRISNDLQTNISGLLCENDNDFDEDNKNAYSSSRPKFRLMLPQGTLDPLKSLDIFFLEAKEADDIDALAHLPSLTLRDLRIEPLKNNEPVFIVGRSRLRKDATGKTTIRLKDCVEKGTVISATENSVKRQTSCGDQAEYFLTSIKPEIGDSGCPVFDKQGSVIGLIATAGGHAIKVSSIQKALKICYLTEVDTTSPGRPSTIFEWGPYI